MHVGHGTVINCRKIGSRVLIGMNSTILHDAEIGDFCIIAAGSLVRQGMKIPNGKLVAGVPGRVEGEASPEQLWWVMQGPDTYAKLAKRYKEQGL